MGVTISPNNASVVKDSTRQFSTTVTGRGGAPAQILTWRVSGSVSGTGISADELLTIAASGLTVTATSAADTGKSGSAVVTVISNTPGYYTVMFESGETVIETLSVQDGGKVTKPADPVRTGYTFDGWHKDSGLSAAWDFAGDTVTAISRFTQSGRRLLKPSPTTRTPGPASYTIESAAITLPVPTKSGYIFGGWYDNSGLTGTAVTVIPHGSTGNRTFRAKWIELATFNLAACTGTGSSGNWSYTSPTLTILDGAHIRESTGQPTAAGLP